MSRRAVLLVALALATARPTCADAQVTFGLPVSVSGPCGGCYVPSLVIAPAGPDAGVPRVFWQQFRGALPGNEGATFAAGSWSAEAPPDFGASRTPRASVDSAGIVHLAWRDTSAGQEDVYHAQFQAGTWTAPAPVASTPGMSRNPVIAVDPFGLPTVMWEDDSSGTVQLWESRFDGAAWTPAADSGLAFTHDVFLDTLRIAFDSGGVLHAVWQEGDALQAEILHATKPAGGAWGLPASVSSSPGSSSTEPSIAVAADDTLYCAWVEQDQVIAAVFDVCLASKPPSGAWSARTNVSRQGTATFRPSVAVGTDGVPRVAWNFETGTGTDVAFAAFPGDAPINVSAPDSGASLRASLALDPDDAAWIAWQQGPPMTGEIDVATTAVASTPVLLHVTADPATGEVVLDWTGGLSPFVVTRSGLPSGGWVDLTPPGGITARTLRDPALRDGRNWYYVVTGR